MKTTATVLPSLFALASAHGYVQQLNLGGKIVDAYNPYQDDDEDAAGKTFITRKFQDNGPVTDGLFTTDAITCNIGLDGKNNVPVSGTAEVAAGADVEFYWTEWKSDHPGPIMTYLADCQGKCSEFSGSKGGKVWVKIDQAGYDASESIPWASKRLPEQNSTWSVTLPKTIAPGEYILRHEILGLQRTNTNGSLAQFYPNCHQITVTGTGTTALPEGIALPGAYQPDDKTSIFLEYRDISADNPYTPPGGPVWGDDGWEVATAAAARRSVGDDIGNWFGNLFKVGGGDDDDESSVEKRNVGDEVNKVGDWFGNLFKVGGDDGEVGSSVQKRNVGDEFNKVGDWFGNLFKVGGDDGEVGSDVEKRNVGDEFNKVGDWFGNLFKVGGDDGEVGSGVEKRNIGDDFNSLGHWFGNLFKFGA